MTLKECNEEESCAGKGRNEHGGVDDPGMDALDGNAQQEATDGDLRQDHGAAVEEIAVEPTFACFLNLPVLKIFVMTTGTVIRSCCRGNTITNEKKLPLISDKKGLWCWKILTVEATMSQSSTPNAFTIFNRTMHRNAFAMIAVARKATFIPMSSGPRLGIAMMLSGGGCLSHGL